MLRDTKHNYMIICYYYYNTYIIRGGYFFLVYLFFKFLADNDVCMTGGINFSLLFIGTEILWIIGNKTYYEMYANHFQTIFGRNDMVINTISRKN